MWPLPEPARPVDESGCDPPVLVRLALDHGCDPPARAESGGPPTGVRPADGSRAQTRPG